MNTLVRVIIVILVFCAGFTLGGGHKPLDFNGDKHINMKDYHYALKLLTHGGIVND